MVHRFGLAKWRNTLISLGVVAGLPACINAAREAVDATSDVTALAETEVVDGLNDPETTPDVTVDVPPDVVPECDQSADCDEKRGPADICNAWSCDDGDCVMVPVPTETPCDDGVFCNGPELCKSGVCAQGFAPCGDTPASDSCIGSFECNEIDRACDPVFRGPTADAYIEGGLTSTEPCGVGASGLCVDQRCVPSDMRLVPAGTFRMGCLLDGSEGDPLCEANAMPAHPVMLDTFAVAVHETTWAEWKRCVDASFAGCTESPLQRDLAYNAATMGNNPVNFLTHSQAAAVCGHSGRRLCTEAEWEKAARGASSGQAASDIQRPFPWGASTPDCSRISAFFACGNTTTSAVGAKIGNISAYGAYDMAGNVAEWVADFYSKNVYTTRDSTTPTLNPLNTSGDGTRILRGGAANSTAASQVKTFRRVSAPPDESLDDLGRWHQGARCCADIPRETAE